MSQHKFLPFGEEVLPQVGFSSKLYTGHERDKETGLDYMLARSSSPSLGRFLAVDSGGVIPTYSSSWNRYTYGLASPVMTIDRSGKEAYVFWDSDGGVAPHSGMAIRDRSTGLFDVFDFGPNTANGRSYWQAPGHVGHRVLTEEQLRTDYEAFYSFSDPLLTTAEDEQALVDWWQDKAANPGTYRWWSGNHCIGAVFDALGVLENWTNPLLVRSGAWFGWLNNVIAAFNRSQIEDADRWGMEHGIDKLEEWDFYFHEMRDLSPWDSTRPTGPVPPGFQ